jgi:predicted nucleic acid-binding protein
MFLLDTNVVSEPFSRRPSPLVMQWLSRHTDCWVSVVTIGELHRGVARLRRRSPGKRVDALARWVEETARDYSDRLLDIDAAVAQKWGEIIDQPRTLPVNDAYIAATALVHGLTVATRNVADFRIPGLGTVNPFEPDSEATSPASSVPKRRGGHPG